MNRSSLQAQIAEVEREIEQRRTVYPRLIAKRTMRESEARLHIERMEDALATLRFLDDHRESFLALIKPVLA